jgi:hypothetical protein
MDIKLICKRFDKVRSTLVALEQNKGGIEGQLKLLAEAIDALKAIDINSAVDLLAQKLSEAEAQFELKLAERRQSLELAARDAHLTHRRLSNIDKVGLFELSYSKAKVTVKIGSEILTTIEEIDGRKLVDRLVLEQKALEENILPRDLFFKSLKSAILFADSYGKVQNGKVKVHDLFAYFVLTRQIVKSDVFWKKPTQKNFTDYSKAMLAFEFFKFGEHHDGWTFGSERLCNQGPNMATQSEALMLPDTGGSTTQILWLWVAKQ